MVLVPEPVGIILYRRDLPVQPLRHRVRDAMVGADQHPRQVVLNHPRHPDHRREAAGRRPDVPPAPVRRSRAQGILCPEVAERLLDRVGSPGLQVRCPEGGEPLPVPLREILPPVEPQNRVPTSGLVPSSLS